MKFFRHQHLDAVDELLGGARSLADDRCLFDEVNFKAADFVDGHPIAEIAVQAVGLFHQQDAALRILSQVADHGIKARSAGPLRRFDIREGSTNFQMVVLRITAQQLVLRGD